MEAKAAQVEISAKENKSKPRKCRKRISALAISLVTFLLLSILMWGIGTSWGYVKVTRIRIVADDGLTYSAIMYVPRSATNENPAPGFMGQHGRSTSGRDMDTWAIEMARRGYVCLLPDAAGGGESQRYDPDYINAPVEEFFNYLNNLSIVQTGNIIISGISQGTDSTAYLASKYSDYISGVGLISAVRRPTSGTLIDSNVLFIYGFKDESINTSTDESNCLLGVVDSFNYATGSTFTEFDEIEQDIVYGSFEDGTARLVHTEPMIHAGPTFNYGSMEAMLDFFMDCAEAPNPIPADNFVWNWHAFLGLCLYINIVVCAALVCGSLIKHPFFATIVQPLPQRAPIKAKRWGISTIIALVAPILIWLYIPWPKLLTTTGTQLFPATHLNGMISWMVYVAIFGLIMLFVVRHINRKKDNLPAGLAEYGLTYTGSKKLSLSLIGKSLLLALIAVWIAFMMLYALEELTGFVPHFWFLSFTKLVSFRLKVVPAYIPLFVLAFGVSAIGMNIERGLPSTGNKTRDLIRDLIVNVVVTSGGITLLLLFQWVFMFNQMTYLGSAGEIISLGQVNNALTLTNNQQFGVAAMTAIGAGMNTYCYKKTGTIWVGTFLASMWTAFSAIMSASLAFSV